MQYLRNFSLRLFDGEGGAAPGGTQSGSAPTQQSGETGASGQQTSTQTAQPTAEERLQAFRKLVGGEYKDIYESEVQRHISKKVKENKGLQTQLDKQKPLMDMLMQRHNILDGNLDSLRSAVENDDAYWTEAAEKAGMSVEQFRSVQRLRMERDAAVAAQKKAESQRAYDEQLRRWSQEGAEAKAAYPDFDLNTEVLDPQFMSLLKAGVPVKLAYEVRHMDAIKTGAAQAAARQAEKSVTENIRARGSRPAENGTSSQSAFTVKDDVSKLTKKQRAEYADRIMRGEKITFG